MNVPPIVQEPSTRWAARGRRKAELRSRLALSDAPPPEVYTSVSHENALEKIPFHMQGALSFYGEETLTRRIELRMHPRVEKVLSVWWQCARRLRVPSPLAQPLTDVHNGEWHAQGRFGSVVTAPSRTQRHGRAGSSKALDPLKPEHPEKLVAKRATERALTRAKSSRLAYPPLGTPREVRAALLMQSAYRGVTCRRVTREQYIAISMKLYYAMVDARDAADARAVAEEEWARDSRGEASIGPDGFKDAIFEFADAWVNSTWVVEYVEFLWMLLWRVCHSSDPVGVRTGTAPPPLWKDDRDIHFTPLDIECDDDETGAIIARRCSFDPLEAHRASLKAYFQASVLAVSPRQQKSAPGNHAGRVAAGVGASTVARISPRGETGTRREHGRENDRSRLERLGATPRTTRTSERTTPATPPVWLPWGEGVDPRTVDLEGASGERARSARRIWRAGGIAVGWALRGFDSGGYHEGTSAAAAFYPRPPRTAPERGWQTRIEGVQPTLHSKGVGGTTAVSAARAAPNDTTLVEAPPIEAPPGMVVHVPSMHQPRPPAATSARGRPTAPRSVLPRVQDAKPQPTSAVVNLLRQNDRNLDHSRHTELLPASPPPKPRTSSIRTHPYEGKGVLAGLAYHRPHETTLRAAWLAGPMIVGHLPLQKASLEFDKEESGRAFPFGHTFS